MTTTLPPSTDFPDEEQFRIMADTAPVMIWIANTEKLCYFFNKGWLDFTGRGMEEEYGNGWASGVHPDDLENCLDIYTTHFDKRAPFTMEYRLRYKDGSYRWLLDNGVARYSQNGDFVGYIGSCIDIQEIKEAQFLREEFISVASHELKTPLTSMGLAIQSLERMYATDPASGRIAVLIKSALSSYTKMNYLVKGLLHISQLEEGQLSLHKKRFSLATAINDCVDSLAIAGTHELVIEGDVNITILADPVRIDQVLTNLINNAVKYAPDTKQIGVKTENLGSAIRISITDKGIGIPEDKLPNVFKRFYRVNRSNNNSSSLGLGLYISNEIIKRHGGEMGVDSKEGDGSTFWFTLPL
ncbi:MAG: hypothetical protein NVSMB24_40420 [Mucilaginibacter sp.]